MGKDKRKKDLGNRQTTPTPNEVESAPKGQRAPRTRVHQKESTKNAPVPVKEKPSVDAPVPQDKKQTGTEKDDIKEGKRETDDIKALKEKKYNKRQIFSNWNRYEEIEHESVEYEIEIKGTGHFQFKSEKSWDAHVAALSGELFSLDTDLLADGLATIPFYKKLDIPINLYSTDEIEDMDHIAHSALKRYEETKKNLPKKKKERVETTEDLLLDESSPTELNTSEEKADLKFNIDQPDIQNEITDSDAITNTESSSYISKTELPEVNTKAYQSQDIPPKSITKDSETNSRIISNPEKTSSSIQERVYTATAAKIEEITTVQEIRKESTPPRNNKQVIKETTPAQEIQKENSAVQEIHKKKTEQEMQQSQLDSPENVFEEPLVPLGQRSSRRKGKGHAQTSGNQNRIAETASETEISGRQNDSKIAENENKTQLPEKQKDVEPDASQLTLINPQKTEDLEDWLDSIIVVS
ncbi:hypothetical protein C0J52_17833 [Blattella germanica]|nr:hypothetical protein C0J52_17833 [Blattella germanica]